jgi:hypothetical protein
MLTDCLGLAPRDTRRNYSKADPDDPSTWHGDHFDMTPRRRKFEAYHKTAGYFAAFCAVGAVASGLIPMPVLTGVILITALVVLVLCIVLEHNGLRYDGYRAAFGNNPDHPHNRARKDL